MARAKDTPLPMPLRSGWCAVDRPIDHWSHARCAGGSNANPTKVWHPCPCDCHTPPKETPMSDEQTPSDQGPDHATPQVTPAEQPDLPTALAALSAAADAVNTAMLGYGADWTEALFHLRDLRTTTTLLGQLDASLVHHLYLHGEHGKRLVDGIGEVWITRGRSKERWEGEAAVKDYIERCLAAVEGEYPDPEQVVAWVLEVVPVYPSTSLRVTPLRTAGLDPDDYRTSEPGNLSVTLPSPT